MSAVKAKPKPGAYPFRDKAMYLDRVKAHRLANELVRGAGWEQNGQVRGCAVGCTLHTYDHSQYPILLGVPIQIAHIEDFLFENLPKCHLKWPERFLSAIKEGADLSNVYSQWVCRMLTRRLESLGYGQEDWRKRCREAIGNIRDLWLKGFSPASVWSAAWSAAESAARSAAWSAAWSAESAARSAARSAAWSAESAARSAAESAAWSAAWSAAESADRSAAWSTEIHRQADDLIELLQSAPVAI